LLSLGLLGLGLCGSLALAARLPSAWLGRETDLRRRLRLERLLGLPV
jgi:hypothetical protein